MKLLSIFCIFIVLAESRRKVNIPGKIKKQWSINPDSYKYRALDLVINHQSYLQTFLTILLEINRKIELLEQNDIRFSNTEKLLEYIRILQEALYNKKQLDNTIIENIKDMISHMLSKSVPTIFQITQELQLLGQDVYSSVSLTEHAMYQTSESMSIFVDLIRFFRTHFGANGQDSIFVKLDYAARELINDYQRCFVNGFNKDYILRCLGNLTSVHLYRLGAYANNSFQLIADTTLELGRVTITVSQTLQGAIYDSVMDNVLTPFLDSIENPTLAQAFQQISSGLNTCNRYMRQIPRKIEKIEEN